MERFAGKTVLITGGARGQGRSHAVGFAGEGANVVVIDIAAADDAVPHRSHDLADLADLEETVRLVEAHDARCLAIQADVRDRGAMQDAVQQAVAEFGGIDIVIANAGIGTTGSIVDQDDADWDATVGTVLHGTWNTLKPTVPHLIERGYGGRILVTASSVVRWPQANLLPYVAAKFGLIGMVKGLALELGRTGITVNAINPGTVDTPMLMNEKLYKVFVPDMENPTQEDAEAVFRRLSINGDPYVHVEDITAGMMFLASPEAQQITGIQLDIAGGTNAMQAG